MVAEFKNELILQTVDSSGAVTKSVVVDLRNALVLTSAPTTATAARVGMQAYVVSGSTVNSEYVCVAAENGVYTWVRRVVESSGGGTGGGSGADGFSPIATVEQTKTGAIITITDRNGTTTATVSNGPKGDPGDDYILTEEDKTEIAEEAADIVDDALSEVIGDPDGAVPAVPGYMALGITGAETGQVAAVSAVDENGVPTAWGAVGLPSGGSGWVFLKDVTVEEDVAYIATEIPVDATDLYAYIYIEAKDTAINLFAGAWSKAGALAGTSGEIAIGKTTANTAQYSTSEFYRLGDKTKAVQSTFLAYPINGTHSSYGGKWGDVTGNYFVLSVQYGNGTIPAGSNISLFVR